MTTLKKLDANIVADRVKNGEALLIDIREGDEYAREHIPGAVSMPVSSLHDAKIKIEPNQHAIFHCKSGMRTDANCTQLSDLIDGEAYMLDGGLDAWRKADLPITTDAGAPMPMNRQVQITAGGLVLLGVILGWLVNPALFGIAAFVGAGLMFAGLSGWCGMAHLLAVMPWNRRAVSG